MKEKIRKFFGEILLVVGSFTTTYELFSFKSSFYGSSAGGLPSLSLLSHPVGDPAVYYYYNNESLFLLSLGVVLIILGIIIIKKKNG